MKLRDYIPPSLIGILLAANVWLACDMLARWVAFLVTGEFPR